MHRTFNSNLKKDFHRLRVDEKVGKTKVSGLGSPLGKGIPEVSAIDWIRREERWNYNRNELERRIPNVFTSGFFATLPFLGGRSEGNVRELTFEEDKPFISNSNLFWYKLAIKKFHKHARSSPEDQARTMHSLRLISHFWLNQGEWPTVTYKNHKMPLVRIPEALTFKHPFLVMRSITGDNYVRADHLPVETKTEVYKVMKHIGKLIAEQRQLLVRHFKRSGMKYPTPDFIPSNIITKLDGKGRLGEIWIIDQFSVSGGPTDEKSLQHGGMRRLGDKDRWGL
jgi:hypothetical protein